MVGCCSLTGKTRIVGGRAVPVGCVTHLRIVVGQRQRRLVAGRAVALHARTVVQRAHAVRIGGGHAAAAGAAAEAVAKAAAAAA